MILPGLQSINGCLVIKFSRNYLKFTQHMFMVLQQEEEMYITLIEKIYKVEIHSVKELQDITMIMIKCMKKDMIQY